MTLNRDPYKPLVSNHPAATPRYFTVQGEGMFPLDMLRYDQAWAVTDIDIDGRDRRTVVCGTISPNGGVPTDDRWSSFGWVVTKREIPPPTELLNPKRAE